jgi:hypothetical protein
MDNLTPSDLDILSKLTHFSLDLDAIVQINQHNSCLNSIVISGLGEVDDEFVLGCKILASNTLQVGLETAEMAQCKPSEKIAAKLSSTLKKTRQKAYIIISRVASQTYWPCGNSRI